MSTTTPATGGVFFCNEGHWFDFPNFARAFLPTRKERRRAARYVGSLAADYHRNLFTGDSYLYPPPSSGPAASCAGSTSATLLPSLANIRAVW